MFNLLYILHLNTENINKQLCEIKICPLFKKKKIYNLHTLNKKSRLFQIISLELYTAHITVYVYVHVSLWLVHIFMFIVKKYF